MKQDKERFEQYYSSEIDENARHTSCNQSRIEFLTTIKYMQQVIPAKSKILDACAGCGFYSFFLAEQGHTVTAGDYVEHNVSIIRSIQERNPVLNDIYTGSAANLAHFSDESFDVVLNMGAYYHIIDKEEREKSISECIRVLRPGGLFFLAYINKFNFIVSSHEYWKEDFSIAENNLERGFGNNSLFYKSTPEEIEDIASLFNLKILHNIATDGHTANITETLNSMDEELFARYMNYHFKVCEIKSILGYSDHALAICRK
jgi:2-polyprenyl-3-methyl-5-hydroxy-6-metoxy-1,4-benzoquinol methylase